jgi:hypothetical protein
LQDHDFCFHLTVENMFWILFFAPINSIADGDGFYAKGHIADSKLVKVLGGLTRFLSSKIDVTYSDDRLAEEGRAEAFEFFDGVGGVEAEAALSLEL